MADLHVNEARIFMSGNSQAVRLPKEFRLPGKRVRVTRSGDSIVLTPIKNDLQAFFEKWDQLGAADFMSEGREQPPMPPDEDLFD